MKFAAEFADHSVHCTRNYHRNREEVEIILVEAGSRIMPNLAESLSASVEKKLREKRVKVLTQARILAQTADSVIPCP